MYYTKYLVQEITILKNGIKNQNFDNYNFPNKESE